MGSLLNYGLGGKARNWKDISKPGERRWEDLGWLLKSESFVFWYAQFEKPTYELKEVDHDV